MTNLDAILNRIDTDIEPALARLFDLLRIPSISTEPNHVDDCRKAGQWVCDQLSGMGFDASLRDTAGHPMVVGHYTCSQSGPQTPHILFYGHYDVQPADPLEKWHTSPFEPTRRIGDDGIERIYARGAQDDKGQLMTFLEASRAWISETGGLPLNVTVLIEGEEESGSPSLEPFLKANKAELTHDIALVCDTSMWNADTPAITTRLRGFVHDEVVITGPNRDLHSGFYGGAAANPIHILAKILSDLHDEQGRVMIEGFYDGVKDLPENLLQQWRDLDFDEQEFLGEIGLKNAHGEQGRMVLEQIWSRPTAEINGIFGGYTGTGTKTVIASEATAKISFRLVGDQVPDDIVVNFRKFVSARVPDDCQVKFMGGEHGSPGVVVSEDNRFLDSAAVALADEFSTPALSMGCGGSIPIVGSFKEILGMDSLLIGFGLNDDAIHSPNEKYNLTSFHRGTKSWARIIAAFAQKS